MSGVCAAEMFACSAATAGTDTAQRWQINAAAADTDLGQRLGTQMQPQQIQTLHSGVTIHAATADICSALLCHTNAAALNTDTAH